jgi:hypothetical protein
MSSSLREDDNAISSSDERALLIANESVNDPSDPVDFEYTFATKINEQRRQRSLLHSLPPLAEQTRTNSPLFYRNIQIPHDFSRNV